MLLATQSKSLAARPVPLVHFKKWTSHFAADSCEADDQSLMSQMSGMQYAPLWGIPLPLLDWYIVARCCVAAQPCIQVHAVITSIGTLPGSLTPELVQHRNF